MKQVEDETRENSLDGLEIGTSVTSYNEKGEVTYAQFRPKMILDHTKELEEQLKTIKSGDAPETLRNNSDVVFAHWFNTLTVIELADREKYKVESEVVHCERHKNGVVMDCYIKYVFKKLPT